MTSPWSGASRPSRLGHMSELPPDLPRLRMVALYAQLQLAAVQPAIRQQEHKAAPTPPRISEFPDWVAEYDISAAHRVIQSTMVIAL